MAETHELIWVWAEAQRCAWSCAREWACSRLVRLLRWFRSRV